MNGAESLVKTLLANGVDTVFANPGTSEMHFVAALDAHPDIRCILCLFEGGTSGAADGYYRMTGQVAATLLHLAPGFGNAFANLHNAAKAHSGVLNLVGDHATYHMRYETPLRGDTAGIAAVISDWTRVCTDAATVAVDGAAAITAARYANGQIATLILPADTAWGAAQATAVCAAPPALPCPSPAQIAAAAAALRQPGAALLLDGVALWGDLAEVAGRIAKATGCALLCPYFAPRLQRGHGAPLIRRMAYRVADNQKLLAKVPTLVLCGADRPASFFAYPGQPSLPEPPGCAIFDLCSPVMDIGQTLHAIAAALEADGLTLGPQDRQPLDLPPLPGGPMDLRKIGQAVAALMPAESIIIDEMVSSAPAIVPALQGARAHDWLNISGAAIGFGLPCAVGAAVACPDRKIVVLQADGSAMYTLQSLWTMARERLDVTVVILANRGYQILRLEMAAMGFGQMGRNAQAMFDVADPTLDWVALARGHGVDAVRVTDTDQFVAAFAGAMAQRGPFVIEVIC